MPPGYIGDFPEIDILASPAGRGLASPAGGGGAPLPEAAVRRGWERRDGTAASTLPLAPSRSREGEEELPLTGYIWPSNRRSSRNDRPGWAIWLTVPEQ